MRIFFDNPRGTNCIDCFKKVKFEENTLQYNIKKYKGNSFMKNKGKRLLLLHMLEKGSSIAGYEFQ
jgi:hypothetical protein